MKPKRDFLYALDQVREVIVCLRPDHMGLPTPDTEWTVSTLLKHMLYELAWVPDIIMGESIESVGKRYDGDLLGDSPIASWRTRAVAASEAVKRCDPRSKAHLSYGDVSVSHYLQEAATDQLAHAWDLGQAIGVDVEFDEALAAEIFERIAQRNDELRNGELLSLLPEDRRSIQAQLLAVLGRRENWRTA